MLDIKQLLSKMTEKQKDLVIENIWFELFPENDIENEFDVEMLDEIAAILFCCQSLAK